MSIWLIIAIIVVVVLIIAFFYLRGRLGVPVLSVRVGTTDGVNFAVEFKELHNQTAQIEYVRIVLHFISKILYVTNEKNDVGAIFKFIEDVSQSDMSDESVLKAIPTNIEIENSNPRQKVITGILHVKDVRTRYLRSKLPTKWFPGQMANSIYTVTLEANATLDELHRVWLRACLSKMALRYNDGANYRDMGVMASLPNAAYWDGISDSPV